MELFAEAVGSRKFSRTQLNVQDGYAIQDHRADGEKTKERLSSSSPG
jgi:hypothetical protein